MSVNSAQHMHWGGIVISQYRCEQLPHKPSPAYQSQTKSSISVIVISASVSLLANEYGYTNVRGCIF